MVYWGGVGVVSHALVGDVGMVAVLVGVVTDGLDAAVGQVHVVFPFGLVAVASFTVTEVGAAVVVVDPVVVGVVSWSLQCEVM